MKGKTIKELKIGDKASVSKTITETDVYMYAGITGDLNPLHVNENIAKDTMFKGRIAHGMLTAGLISNVIAMQLPGSGTIYMGQELKFVSPVRFEDTITAEVEVVEFIKDKMVRLKTDCTNQEGTVVLEGYALVMPPK